MSEVEAEVLRLEVARLKEVISSLVKHTDHTDIKDEESLCHLVPSLEHTLKKNTHLLPDINTSTKDVSENCLNTSGHHKGSARILLAEDNIMNQEVMHEQMTILGYDIDIVENGLQAQEAAEESAYDLIFMDGHMPVMNGFKAAKAIRKIEQDKNDNPTTIIALTADISSDIRARCKDFGMNDYLAKPFTISDLENILKKWLGCTASTQPQIEATKKNEQDDLSDILNMSIIDNLRAIGQNCEHDTLGNTIKRFNEFAPEQLKTIQAAVKFRDFDAITSAAHGLKSASSTIGANLIYTTASEIEQLAINKDIGLIQQALAALDRQLPQTFQTLDNLKTTSSTSSLPVLPAIGSGQYLLIVDDDQIALENIQTAMQQLGYKVDISVDGEKAIQLVNKNNYDLVITDLQMPGMNGYALCESIRKTHSVESLPILVLTCTGDDIHVQDAYSIGVSNFIVKPVNFLNLAYTVLFTIQNVRNTHELWHSRQLLEAAEQTAQVSHWSWELNKQHLQFSSHLQEYFNKPLSNIKNLDDFIDTVGDNSMDTAVRTCLANGTQTSWEQEVANSDQEESRYILHRFRMVLNEDKKPVLIGTVQEISSIRHAEQRIMELAFYDSLTKLRSRSCFNKKLQDLIIYSKRRAEKFALLYLDLDDFKNINDSYGHDVGDQLLIEVADRLRTLLREDDIASRLGGDEFCLLINNFTDNLSVANVAQRCLEILTKPVTLAGIQIVPHASIGIAVYPHDGDDTNHLVKAADTAMYEAKQAGKNSYAFYEAAMTDAAQHRLTIESDLRTALKDEQFELYYQPKISLSTGTVQSVEALIRWHHPVKGLCAPDTFITDAERMGLINELGLWVVQEACRQIKVWEKQGLEEISIAVNISPKHFEHASFSADIAKIVSDSCVSTSLIEIEITESVSRDHKIFLKTCKELRALGFKTAIDDFGTGYSSLSVLKDAAVDILKIDREFVRHLPNDSQSAILFGTILGMSKALNLQVVAEGIETEEQLTALVTMGCHMAQGYYFSKPVPAAEIPALSKCCFRRPRSKRTAYL
jgi:diguanylate cyclase (GGDEF)-like protein